MIAWTGRSIGRDTLTAYIDEDDDGTRDSGEEQRTATVDWRVESAVDPPVVDPLIAPDGTVVAVTLTSEGDDRFFGITPWEAERFPSCADGSPQVDMRLHVNVDPGEARWSPGA